MKIKAKTILVVTILIISTVLISSNSHAELDGENLFKQNCASCHKTNTKRLVGPGLQGSRERQGNEWVIKWTQNSKELIASGDMYANEVYEQFNKSAMPPQNLKDEEIMAIFDYIDTKAVTPSVKEEIKEEKKETNEGSKEGSLYMMYGIAGLMVVIILGAIFIID
ncbi:MAG: cytochrome c [Flavobacteriales bacterium]|nr:cytochrome c [Flavobacteriales bacterium]